MKFICISKIIANLLLIVGIILGAFTVSELFLGNIMIDVSLILMNISDINKKIK